jgi:dihydrofolate synthase/folylpolyglutamate synthase
MEIDGAVVSQERFANAILKAHDAAQQAVADGRIWGITEFELLTAAALWLFSEEHVDFAVLEVGLGGRWDATSVVDPKVAVITGVGLDHTEILGNTIEEIAAEKAAIIKPGCIPILGPGTEDTCQVFFERCDEVGTKPLVVPNLPSSPDAPINPSRFPSYQQQNILCALVATRAALGDDTALDVAAIQHVLDTLVIPGRFELVREHPPLLIDAAHNPQSAKVLAKALTERYGRGAESGYIKGFDTLLLGILTEKDAEGIIAALAPLFDTLAITQSASPRAIPADELAFRARQIVDKTRRVEVFTSVPLALDELTKRGASVVATGSITLAGEVKQVFCRA